MKPGPLAAAAAIAAAVLLSHLPLFRAGYVQDDHVAIEGSRIVASGDASAIVAASYWEGARGGDRSLYRPVTVATYALEAAAGDAPRPFASHAINVALHAAVCWLLFMLAIRAGIDPKAAILAALLFAVTPSKSEAVANVVGRAELLAALFTIAAVVLALRVERRSAWAAAVCVFFACLSKETGIVALPLVAVAAAIAGQRSLAVLGTIAPSVLAFEVFVILRTRALEAFFPAQIVPPIDNPLVAEHGARYFATALGLIARYARIVAFPFGLSNDYSCRSIPIEASWVAWAPAAGLAVLGVLVWVATRSRLAALGVAIVLLPYLLVSNLLVPVGAIMAERFLYLPVVGVSLLAALLIAKLGRPARIACVIVIAVLGVAMFSRALDWKDDATIFAATARSNPRSPRAWLWVGKPDRVIECCPEFAAGWHDRGVALARSGDLAGAESALREAVRLDPTRTAPHLNLGIVLHRRRELPAAEREIRKATLVDPENPRAYAELGHLRSESGDRAGAAAAYRRAIDLGRKDLLPRLREVQ